MNAAEQLRAELVRLRTRIPELTQIVLASADGLVLAHDATGGVEPDALAALAASHVALAARFAAVVGHGPLREAVVAAAGGHVASYQVGDALLAVVFPHRVTLARVHFEARRAMERLVPLLAAIGPVTSRPTAPPPPARHGARLPRRIPMASIPGVARGA